MAVDFSFAAEMHIRRPSDFEKVYGAGVKAGDAHLLVFAIRNGLAISRIGMSVSKKHGPAVVRNLKRRRLREAFRLLQHGISNGIDFILIPRQRDDSTLQDFQVSLIQLTERLARRLPKLKRPPEPEPSL